MTDAELDIMIDGMAAALRLRILPEGRGAVRANLAVSLRMGAMVMDFPLPDEAEPAPVFEA